MTKYKILYIMDFFLLIIPAIVLASSGTRGGFEMGIFLFSFGLFFAYAIKNKKAMNSLFKIFC